MLRPQRLAILATLLFVLTVAPLASAQPGASGDHAVLYYLSLGNSLAAGVQADATGESIVTHEGYTDQLYAALREVFPTLRHEKLGCPGETTVSIGEGGICPYPHGTQLAEAVRFLHAHRQFVVVVTIDLGANDVLPCVAFLPDLTCLVAALGAVGTNLPTILDTLREAAGPDVPIVGMSYYNPFLAAWLSGPQGQALAVASTGLALAMNNLLRGIYLAGGSAVADVEGAFSTTRFDILVPLPPFGLVPLNVVRVCQWTWMCVPPPAEPNIHANTTGYGVIAGAFLAVLP